MHISTTLTISSPFSRIVFVMTGFDRDSFVNVDKNKVHRFIGPVSGNMIPFKAERKIYEILHIFCS